MESIFYYRTSIIEFVSFKRAIVAPTIRRLFHTRDRVYKILIYVYTYVLRRVSFLARGTRSKSYDRTRNTFRRIRENQRNPSKFFFRRKNTTRCFPISKDRETLSIEAALFYTGGCIVRSFQQPLTRSVELRLQLIEKV